MRPALAPHLSYKRCVFALPNFPRTVLAVTVSLCHFTFRFSLSFCHFASGFSLFFCHFTLRFTLAFCAKSVIIRNCQGSNRLWEPTLDGK